MPRFYFVLISEGSQEAKWLPDLFFPWGMGLAQVSVARGSNPFPVEGETCSHGYGVLQVVIFWWPQTNKREVAPKEGGGQEEGLRNHRFATDKKTLMYGSFFPVSKRKYVALLILKKKKGCVAYFRYNQQLE